MKRRHLARVAAESRLPLLHEERDHAPGGAVLAHLRHAVSAAGLLAGGYVANRVDAVTGVVMLLAGGLAGAGLAAAAGVPCNRYGLDPGDAAKPCLGVHGAKALLLVFWLNHLVWSGLMLVMLARGCHGFLSAAGVVPPQGLTNAVVAVGILMTYLGAVGPGSPRIELVALAMPALMTMGGIVMFSVLHDIAWTDLTRIPALTPGADARMQALGAFECALGLGLAKWPGIARLSRRARTQRTGFYAAWLTSAAAITAMGTTGLCAALLLRSFDPTQWVVFLGGRAFGALALVMLMAADLAAAGCIMRWAIAALGHMPRLRAAAWRRCVALLFAPLGAFVLYPHVLYEHGDAIVITFGYVLAPLCGVLLVDHVFLRAQRLNIVQVFETEPRGHYRFCAGFNAGAWLSAMAGIALAWSLYNPWTGAAHALARVAGATLPATLGAGLAYAVINLAARHAFGRTRGGYGRESADTRLRRCDI